MKKWKTLLLLALLVVLILGAGALYDGLKDQVRTDPLVGLQPQTPPETQETTLPPAPSEETAAPEETAATETGDPTEGSSADSSHSDYLAPDFVVYDAEGNEVTLESMRGKPVILNFWATWCGYCVMEMPEFQTMYETYGDQIHFMMINVTDGYQETQEKAESFIAESGYSFPVYFDLELSAGNAYGVNAMPVTYFIDEEGCLIAYGQGAMSASAIQQGVDMILDQPQQ